MLISALARERLPAGARGLDLCTGSGVLAVAAAAHGCAEVLSVDISRRAVLAAWLNGRLNGFRIRALRGDLYGPVAGKRFDLIVSNPPYVPTPDGELPRRGLARAWEGGPDGRAFIDRICAGAREHLQPGGVMLLVHSSVCGERATLAALRAQGLQTTVALRHEGRLGPILDSRKQWLHQRGLLDQSEREQILVVRAQASDAPRGPLARRMPTTVAVTSTSAP